MSFLNVNQLDLIRQAKLLQYANTKRNDGNFNDVTIQAGAESISANRMVLACYSKFFESMFLSQLKQRYQHSVEINEFDGKAVNSIIEYIYTCKIDINEDNVMALLRAADFLQVDDVKQMCFDYLESVLTIDNCLDVIKAFLLCNNSSPLQQTYQFISENFDEIAQRDSFTDISKLDLASLLTNVDRNAVQETSLYTAIINWVKHDETRKTEFSSLFLKLDFQRLSLDFVLNTIANEELVKNNIDCLNAAFSYFTSTTKQANQQNKLSKILCLGGSHNNDVIEVYHCSRTSQSFYSSLPLVVSRHRALKLDNCLYCIGGIEIRKNRGRFLNAILKLNESPYLRKFSTKEVYRLNLKRAYLPWEKIASMNENRCDFGAATWNGNLVVTGGLVDTGGGDLFLFPLYSTELHEPCSNKWKTIASMNEGRRGHELVVANDKLFAIGGSVHVFKDLSSVEQLDNVDGRWTFTKSMNVERCWLAAVTCNDFIYAIGGCSLGKPCKTVEKFDPKKNEWSFVRNMNIERSKHAGCVLNGKIFVIGGRNAKDEDVKQIESYDPISDEWSIVGETEQEFYDRAFVAV